MSRTIDNEIMYQFFANTCTEKQKQEVEDFFYNNDSFRETFLDILKALNEEN